MSGGSAVGPNLRLAAAAGLAFLAVFSLLGPLGPATVARDGATPAAAPALSHPTNAPQRPKMYTYFASVKALHPEPELLQKWKRSWAKAGWDAEILTEEDARAHPQWPKLHLALRRLPSSNPTGYDAACYFRWLAVAARGGGWLSDYDVLNYGG